MIQDGDRLPFPSYRWCWLSLVPSRLRTSRLKVGLRSRSLGVAKSEASASGALPSRRPEVVPSDLMSVPMGFGPRRPCGDILRRVVSRTEAVADLTSVEGLRELPVNQWLGLANVCRGADAAGGLDRLSGTKAQGWIGLSRVADQTDRVSDPKGFSDPSRLLARPVSVAAPVGENAGPVGGRRLLRNGSAANRLAGGPVSRLPGPAGYECIGASDERRVEPRPVILRDLFPSQPTSILLNDPSSSLRKSDASDALERSGAGSAVVSPGQCCRGRR